MSYNMFKSTKTTSASDTVQHNDIEPNNTSQNCLKNVEYKLKNKLDLSEANLSCIAAPDITGTKIQSLDFMQWAMIGNNINNVQLLSGYFNKSGYSEYLQTLPMVVQENLGDLFKSTPSNKH